MKKNSAKSLADSADAQVKKKGNKFMFLTAVPWCGKLSYT